VKVSEPDIASALRDLARHAKRVVIATDYDREGELIGSEALDIVLQTKPKIEVVRMRYSALTREEVTRAFDNTSPLDVNLATAAKARQLIDLSWGAVLTRYISLATEQRGRDFLSVGRVQTPTLALIVDREREIRTFIPKPFWKLDSRLKQDEVEFNAEHSHGIFWEEEEARRVHALCHAASSATISSFEQKEEDDRPPSPFDTTSFLAELSGLGITPARGMSIAESLYTRGFISYPRTDNTVYPPSLSLRGVVDKIEDGDLAPVVKRLREVTEWRPTRGRRQTTDHPPIYPTSGASKKKLGGDGWRVYELVVRRFLATLAPWARFTSSEAKLSIEGEGFVAKGKRYTSLGWYEFYPYWSPQDTVLPILTPGETVGVLRVSINRDETKPPGRYSAATLLREMDRLMLGTKSTRHDIIQKLYDRKFVEGRNPTPTPQGEALVESLERHANLVTSPEMTATLEADMDLIAEGQKGLDEVVEESRAGLSKAVAALEKHRDDLRKEMHEALDAYRVIGKCSCGKGELQIVVNRGLKFAGCTRYPDCREMHPLPPTGRTRALGRACERCGMPMVEIHQGRKVLQECISQECEGRAKGVLAKCPSCKSGDLLERRSPRGKRFVSCTSYPDCKNSYPLPQFGKIISKGVCEHCTAPQVLTYTHRGPWTFCVNMQCPERLARQARREERAKLKVQKEKLKARKAKAREKKRLEKANAKEEKEKRKLEKLAVAVPVSVETAKPEAPKKRAKRKATKKGKVVKSPKKATALPSADLISEAGGASHDHVDDSRSPDE
ncbi:MAG TPA: DNA topoisomerase I, partial [Thermoplasmata archaeon]|nr:DNA topoisomerase I [Thermoplasmata archaeon]